MIPTLTIDSKKVVLSSFVVPEMNLSSLRSSMQQHKYLFSIHSSQIIKSMQEEFDQLVIELREDDEQMGEPQDELAKAGYPNLQKILMDRALTQLIFGNYLIRELLSKFTWDGHSEILYWFGSCDSCTIKNDLIHLTGACYTKI